MGNQPVSKENRVSREKPISNPDGKTNVAVTTEAVLGRDRHWLLFLGFSTYLNTYEVKNI